MPNDDRERQFERALTRHLRDASPDSACPDAEILAAYHERTLSPEEMARWKEHIAGCARCQESLALVEQSESIRAEEWQHQNVPVPLEDLALPKSVRSARANIHQAEEVRKAAPTAEVATPIRKPAARLRLRWIVPVGTLAASVIVWISLREIRMQHGPALQNVQVAQNKLPAPQPPAHNYRTADQLKQEPPAAQNRDDELRLQKAPAVPPAKVGAQRETGAPATSNALPSPASEPANNDKKDLIAGAAPAPPPPPPPLSSYDAKSRAKEKAALPAAGAASVGGVTADRAAEVKKQAALPSVAESVEVTAAAPTANTASTADLPSKSTELTMQARNVTNLMHLAAVDRRFILAPGEKHVWRVGDSGKIERSTDRGKSWKLQKSGVTADLTAGSATSDKVCWVVGKAGTVLLTTDGGKHWKQIPSPIPEDLGGIHSTDALHASIWDVPNRKSFETTDGGATWNRTSSQ